MREAAEEAELLNSQQEERILKIVCLVENTPGRDGCGTEHGLCLYVESRRHKLLLDTGASDLFVRNAEKMGIRLEEVDTVVLSHGHSDHGGGIPSFTGLNPNAVIYLRAEAEGEYYAWHDPEKEPDYIGLDRELGKLPQLIHLRDDCRIDEELMVFSLKEDEFPLPPANRPLKEKQGEAYVQDAFRHEQYLVLSEGDRKVLFSGCCHHGIRNVLAYYRKLFGASPDVVVSGFHLMQRKGYTDEDIREITDTALALKDNPSVYYTGHCTGEQPYEMMKEILGDRLHYLHCGDELVLDLERRDEQR